MEFAQTFPATPLPTIHQRAFGSLNWSQKSSLMVLQAVASRGLLSVHTVWNNTAVWNTMYPGREEGGRQKH